MPRSAENANKAEHYQTQQEMSSSMQMSVVIVPPFISLPPFLPFHATLTTPGFYRPLQVIHSALCTRVLLNLRKASTHSSDGIHTDEVARHSTLAFDHASGEGDICFDGEECWSGHVGGRTCASEENMA